MSLQGGIIMKNKKPLGITRNISFGMKIDKEMALGLLRIAKKENKSISEVVRQILKKELG